MEDTIIKLPRFHGKNLPLHKQISKEIQQDVANVHELLLRANFNTTRRFYLGIIHRLENLNLLRQTIRVLSTMKEKDFTYSRSQCNSSSLHSQKEFSTNKFGIPMKGIENQIRKIWSWFSSISDNNKANFLYCITMAIDDSTILHQALNLAKTVYAQQKKEQSFFTDDESSVFDELDSLPSSTHTFRTYEHPDLYMLAALKPQFKISPGQLSETFSLTAVADALEDHDERLDQGSETSDSSEISLDPRMTISRASKQALSGVMPFVDYVAKLPVHLSKKIIGLLDPRTQVCAAYVSKIWCALIRQVRLESETKQEIREEAVMMQGVSVKGAHPNYAKKKIISIPIRHNEGINKQSSTDRIPSRSINSFDEFEIVQCEMEERNVYCGSYNVLILDKQADKHRVIHHGGGSTILSGSTERIIRLFSANDGREILPPIRGHPGSITSVFVANDGTGYIFSGSYDTTIRRWKLGSSSCQQILHGHRKSVTNLDYSSGTLISGANDGLIKVWNIASGKCVCTFKHSKCLPINSIKFHKDTILSSCDRGLIKVWDISQRRLSKTLVGHSDAVSSVSLDEHYIVSGSHDGYVMTWIRNGNINQHVKAYRHPKKVLCVELCYLRIISGCEDGKLRVLHLHSGECLRVVRGNSKCDPIVSFCATSDKLVVNTASNMLLLQFEPISWEYELASDRDARYEVDDSDWYEKPQRLVNNSRSYTRAYRNRASSISCSNIYRRPISAPVKKKSLPTVQRPMSFTSFSNFSAKEAKSNSVSPRRHHIFSRNAGRLKSASEGNFNVHASRAMSVISGISSMILQNEQKSNTTMSSHACTTPMHRFSSNDSCRRSNLSRDRIHLRIGSIHHNTRSEVENINTALNGGHPDIREIFHQEMKKFD